MNVVVARLIGGLGNQMFQYAAGRALALRCGAELRIDISGFAIYQRRRYELDTLRIKTSVATKRDLAQFGLPLKAPSRFMERVQRRLGILPKLSARSVYHEPHFHFDPGVLKLLPPVYLDGYWQSEKYFADQAAVLRQELTPAMPLDPENAVIAERIDATNAVSLHVRRGDYAHDPATNRFHGTCSVEYYGRAVDYMMGRVPEPHLFVFSDDWEWASGNLHFDVPTTFVHANSADRGFSDMQLMSRCRHHILANSSFSWWGAWLNPSQDKVVIAPKCWFNDRGADTRDLIPESWIRL